MSTPRHIDSRLNPGSGHNQALPVRFRERTPVQHVWHSGSYHKRLMRKAPQDIRRREGTALRLAVGKRLVGKQVTYFKPNGGQHFVHIASSEAIQQNAPVIQLPNRQ
jgi:hypothetical protein